MYSYEKVYYSILSQKVMQTLSFNQSNPVMMSTYLALLWPAMLAESSASLQVSETSEDRATVSLEQGKA